MALSDDRHAVVLEQVNRLGRIRVGELASRLDVSDETIRRDLRTLERAGLLRCVYGGAVAQATNAKQDQPLTDRMRLHRWEKARLAQRAAAIIPHGATLFLDTGTTTLALAQALTIRKDVAVVTNSLDIARLLASAGLSQVSVTGGAVRGSDNALVGHATIAAVRAHVFDIAFMGIAAVDVEYGFMDYGSEESALRQTLADHARRCVILADHSKFGRTARLRTFTLEQVRTLVTDKRPPAAFASRFAEVGMEVLYGGPAH